jgi:hypothetical protein
MEFLTHVKWAPDGGNGLVEWWVNGIQYASRYTPTLYNYPDGTVSHVNYQLGYYRYRNDALFAPWDETVFFAEAKVGPTRPSVGG